MLNSYVVSVTLCFTFPNFVSGRCGQSYKQANGNNFITSRRCVEAGIQANGARQSLTLEKPVNGQEPLPPPIEKPRNRCCPYDFDSRLCKIVDDRVLCGYNTNVGRPQGNDHEVQLGDNCRLRNGRLECGYINGPFTNPRRPPPWYNPETGDDHDNNIETYNDEPHHDEKDYPKDISIEVPSDTKLKLKQTKPTPSPAQHQKGVTRCVEIHDRIVCRHM